MHSEVCTYLCVFVGAHKGREGAATRRLWASGVRYTTTAAIPHFYALNEVRTGLLQAFVGFELMNFRKHFPFKS